MSVYAVIVEETPLIRVFRERKAADAYATILRASNYEAEIFRKLVFPILIAERDKDVYLAIGDDHETDKIRVFRHSSDAGLYVDDNSEDDVEIIHLEVVEWFIDLNVFGRILRTPE